MPLVRVENPQSKTPLIRAIADYADMQSRDPDDRAPSVTLGVGRAILSNRISHYLNIKGPRYTDCLIAPKSIH